jgi:hypothetical protein
MMATTAPVAAGEKFDLLSGRPPPEGSLQGGTGCGTGDRRHPARPRNFAKAMTFNSSTYMGDTVPFSD